MHRACAKSAWLSGMEMEEDGKAIRLLPQISSLIGQKRTKDVI